MFQFIEKVDVTENCFVYCFNVLAPDQSKIGTVGVMVGLGRHDASLVFDEGVTIMDALPYIETLRDLLDNDLLPIEEQHEKIVLAEIWYK